jgi:hypothetical protein
VIIPSTGEVGFADGLRITAHVLVSRLLEALPQDIISTRELPIEGWRQHVLGKHASNHGVFFVEVATGSEGRVEAVFLSHCHEFYDSTTPIDSERRVYHEGIIASDLRGQREFSWGYVFCRLDSKVNQDWLVVIYSPFSTVPLHRREVYKVLIAHEPSPST